MNNKSNNKKLNIKKKLFRIKKNFLKSYDNNVNNINKNENIKIKFNIIKFDDNSIFQNKSKKSELSVNK